MDITLGSQESGGFLIACEHFGETRKVRSLETLFSFLPRVPFWKRIALQKRKAVVILEKDLEYEFNNPSA